MGFIIEIYDKLHIFGVKVKDLTKDLMSFLFAKIFLIIALVLNLSIWYFAYFMYSKASQEIVILHYNIDFGINLIGNKSNFFTIPLAGSFFLVINFVVLLLILKNNDFKFWAYFLLSFLLLLDIFLILALLAMYIINF